MDINNLMNMVSDETKEKIKKLVADDVSKAMRSIGYVVEKKEVAGGRLDKTSLNPTKSRRPNVASFFPLDMGGHNFDSFEELAQMCHTLPGSKLKEMLYLPKDTLEAKLIREKHLDPIEEEVVFNEMDEPEEGVDLN